MDHRIPVTLLTGFLGAGKTTLLNALLDDASTGKMAVIVNEFGEAGLDHDLIERVDEEIALMQSGCLCCSLRGDLSRTIGELTSKRADGALDFDRIVIETTGLAEPGPILQTLRMDPALVRSVKMDGVVTVADAANGPATLDAQFEAVSQIAIADLIVISKTDLVGPEQVIPFEERLRGINPTAKVIHAPKGEGVAGRIAGLTALRMDAAPEDVLAWTTKPEPPVPGDALGNLTGLTGLPPASPDTATAQPHDGRIASASIIIDTPLSDAPFDRWLNTMLSMRGDNILRMKGIVFLEDLELPFVFHGVQHVFEPPVPLKSWKGGPRETRIVIIARDLPERELRSSLEMLRAEQAVHDRKKTTAT